VRTKIALFSGACFAIKRAYGAGLAAFYCVDPEEITPRVTVRADRIAWRGECGVHHSRPGRLPTLC